MTRQRGNRQAYFTSSDFRLLHQISGMVLQEILRSADDVGNVLETVLLQNGHGSLGAHVSGSADNHDLLGRIQFLVLDGGGQEVLLVSRGQREAGNLNGAFQMAGIEADVRSVIQFNRILTQVENLCLGGIQLLILVVSDSKLAPCCGICVRVRAVLQSNRVGRCCVLLAAVSDFRNSGCGDGYLRGGAGCRSI